MCYVLDLNNKASQIKIIKYNCNTAQQNTATAIRV